MKFKLIFLALALTTFAFASCSDDDEPTIPEVTTNTIVDIAVGDAQFSTLVAALTRTNLVATLQSAGPFTVFAPTNDAFAALGVDLATISDADLTNILLNHVLGAAVTSGDLADGQTYASTASASGPGGEALSILIEKGSAGVSINGAINVTTADVAADNGVVHIVDAVVMPLDIVGHAVANSAFTSLVGALSSAPGGLVGALQATGPFTVFAPTNGAFDAISDVVAGLSPEQLTTVLTYHVVAGANVTSGALTDDMVVATLSGQDITIDLDGGASIKDQSGADVAIALVDVQGTNGVIHVIETVLLPSL